MICILGSRRISDAKWVLAALLILGWYNWYFVIAAVLFNFLDTIDTASKNYYVQTLTLMIMLQFGLAILQVLIGQGVGLKWIGEADLQVAKAGVSKFNLLGREFLRGYGTFAHPNILGVYGLWFLRDFRLKVLNIFSFSLAANMAQIFIPKFRVIFLLFPTILLVLKSPFANSASYTQRIAEVANNVIQIELMPTHNIFLELMRTQYILLIPLGYILYWIYSKSKNTAFILLFLGCVDHLLISHPQGIIIWGLVPLFISCQSSSSDHLESLESTS